MSASPAKVKKAAKPRKPADHPKYIDMVTQAITSLKERGGSSRQKILAYVCANFKVDKTSANQHLKVALRNGVKSGALKQSKGVGASGSFRVGEKKAAKPKKAVKKVKAAKKSPTKKAAGAKKAAKPKKAAAKKVKKPKTPKKAKSPAKRAAKPKTPKAKPAKKAAKKSPKKAKKAAKK